MKANLRYIGGLIGRNRGGDVANSYATGTVVGDFGPVTGSYGYVGGLIGRSSDGDAVKDSYATGNVTANSDYIGGLIGYAVGSVTNSYATGQIVGESYVGGLIGDGESITISGNTATGDVTGQGNSVGGLAGFIMEGNTSNSSASGDVRGDQSVGGLVGEYVKGTITESYAMGSVTAANRNEGGLVGSFQNGDVSLSYAAGEVNGHKNTGGLIGELVNSSVTYSYATGNVTGSVDAGGLIGGNRNGDLFFSFATGTVSGCDDIGGLVGDTDDGITSNSYATGNVTGCSPGSDSIGGLIGDNRTGTIENSFAIGSITGSSNVGGLVGENGSGSITNSYYDRDLSGQSDNKGQGLTSEQMKNIENYDDWDFDTLWKVDQHHDGYPYLVGMQAFLTYMGNDSNDGSGLYVSKPYRIGSSVTIEDFNWTRTGYLFQGWNTESNGSGVQYPVGDTRPLNSNLLLYATWNQVNGGSNSGSESWRSNNANLAKLIVSSDGVELALSPEFAPGITTGYRAETTSSEATIKATPSDTWATVSLDDAVLDGEKTVVLAEGDNIFEIVVKAEDGTIKTYSLTIHRIVEPEIDPTLPEAPVCPFHDIAGHWASPLICEAFERGLIKGHSETRFSPQSDITRVEFAAILLRTIGVPSSASPLSEQRFIDQDQIPAWATSTVSTAVENGILNGYPDHSLRPLNSVSRAEMVTMIARAMKWEIEQGNTTFVDDADIPHWAKGYILEAVQKDLVSGRDGNRFSPSDSATRAEATVLLLRLWHLNQ